jgi:hypothetical protein
MYFLEEFPVSVMYVDLGLEDLLQLIALCKSCRTRAQIAGVWWDIRPVWW